MKSILTIFTLLFLVSCGKTIEHKRLNVHPETQSYLNSFQILNKKNIDNLDMTIAEVATENVLAYCQKGGVAKKTMGLTGVETHIYATPRVVVDKDFWDDMSQRCEADRNSLDCKQAIARKEEVVYHELGHCVLDRPHDDSTTITGIPKSIMNKYHLGDRNGDRYDKNIYLLNYSNYINELFFNKYAYSGMTFSGEKYASTALSSREYPEFEEFEVEPVRAEDLHEGCVHDKGMVHVDETQGHEE